MLKIYLSGVLFNLIIVCFYYYKDRKALRINIKSLIGFILGSWLVYPLILMQVRI